MSDSSRPPRSLKLCRPGASQMMPNGKQVGLVRVVRAVDMSPENGPTRVAIAKRSLPDSPGRHGRLSEFPPQGMHQIIKASARPHPPPAVSDQGHATEAAQVVLNCEFTCFRRARYVLIQASRPQRFLPDAGRCAVELRRAADQSASR